MVPEDMSIPRAEVLAAENNAIMGHVVKLSFGEIHKKSIKVVDSQVALHWTTKTELKVWVRNWVLEINRLAPKENWRYARSQDNIADMGTRKGATIEDIGPDSEWCGGRPWMILPEDQFPLLTVQETILSGDELAQLNKERIDSKVEFRSHWASVELCEKSEVGKRYAFSNASTQS